jgi:hypothetical protein
MILIMSNKINGAIGSIKKCFFDLTFSADRRILLVDDSPALSGLGSL